MSYTLFAHPFSSYSWKAMIAFHEKELPYELRITEGEDVMDELRRYWPIGKFPVLVDDTHQPARPIIEATTIIEYLDLRHYERGPLIPATASDALEVRFLDRVFDNHVMTPTQAVVAEELPHLIGVSDPVRAEKAKEALQTIYDWLEVHLSGRTWASGQGFSLADCAAAPSLLYADWVHPIDERYSSLRAYRERLLERPSVARCIEGARPYRDYFPLGAPDSD